MSFQALEGPDSYNSILWRVQVPLLDFNQCNRVLSSVLSVYLRTNVRDTLIKVLNTATFAVVPSSFRQVYTERLSLESCGSLPDNRRFQSGATIMGSSLCLVP